MKKQTFKKGDRVWAREDDKIDIVSVAQVYDATHKDKIGIIFNRSGVKDYRKPEDLDKIK